MKTPWVSRERLDEANARVARLEAERTTLLDRIAALSGQQPIYTAAPATALVEERPMTRELKEKLEREPGRRLTRQELINKMQERAKAGKLGRHSVRPMTPGGTA